MSVVVGEGLVCVVVAHFGFVGVVLWCVYERHCVVWHHHLRALAGGMSFVDRFEVECLYFVCVAYGQLGSFVEVEDVV